MSNIQCLEVLSRTSRLLYKVGALPTKRKRIFQTFKSSLNLILVILVLYIICHNIINGIRTKNIELINHMTCVVFIPVFIVIVKISSFYLNKSSFLTLLNILESDVFNEHSHELNKHIQQVDRISKFVLLYITAGMCVAEFALGILPLVIQIKLTIPAPFALGRFKIWYNIFHTLLTVYLAVSSTAIDLLYLTLMGLSVAQLNILGEKLFGILGNTIKQTTNIHIIYYKANQILRECIVLHKNINMYIDELNILISMPFLTQYLLGCFTICYTLVQLTLTDTSVVSIISICGYASVTFFQLLAYHWVGHEIMEKSVQIIESSYLSMWYELDQKSKKTLILLTERAKRPLFIHPYKFVFISLDSLGVIVRWSYSFFALVKAKYS